MHDLRRRALESNKTVSRKAKAKVASRAASGASTPTGKDSLSPASSHAGSRATSAENTPAHSHAGSDEEWDASSMASGDLPIDDALANSLDAQLDLSDTSASELESRVSNILDRKHRNPSDQLQDLKIFYAIARSGFHAEVLSQHLIPLIQALLKTLREASSSNSNSTSPTRSNGHSRQRKLLNSEETAAILALKSLSVLVLTTANDEDHTDLCARTLSHTFSSTFVPAPVKAAAIQTFALTIFLSTPFDTTADSPNTRDTHPDLLSALDTLSEIISTDGASVDALDNAPVVVSAIQGWSLLASRITSHATNADLAESTADTLVEQLTSTDTSVAVSASEALALLYEKSHRAYDPADDDPASVPLDLSTGQPTQHIKLHDVFRRKDLLLEELHDLANHQSSRRKSKEERRRLREAFNDAAACVERPWLGPRFVPAVLPVSPSTSANGDFGDGHDASDAEEPSVTISRSGPSNEDIRGQAMEDSRFVGSRDREGRRRNKAVGNHRLKVRVAPKWARPDDLLPVDSWWMFVRVRAVVGSVLAGDGVMAHWAVGEEEGGVLRGVLGDE